MTHVESNGGYVIRGAGCPLAALTDKYRGLVWQWKAWWPRSLESRFVNVAIAPNGPDAVLKSRGAGRVG
jgi:hypothetical protein